MADVYNVVVSQQGKWVQYLYILNFYATVYISSSQGGEYFCKAPYNFVPVFLEVVAVYDDCNDGLCVL